MHKATFLEGTLCLTITPDGPILIKAGESGGADPTLPDMEFVRTRRRSGDAKGAVYIPGPSLKGVVRAQCERICRSLDSEQQQQRKLEQRQKLDEQEWAALVRREQEQASQQGRGEPTIQRLADKKAKSDDKVPLADNPLGEGKKYNELDDLKYSSGKYIEDVRDSLKEYPERTAIIYRRSSFVSQMFGNTSMAGHVRFADAYGEGVVTEERNGVAIDRVYGSVAVGPFNYETAVAGTFPTRIDFKNLTLAQLALLGLALRDLAEGRVALGFGKSRGLGRVKVTFDSLTLRYPACELQDGKLRLLNGTKTIEPTKLVGVGAFVQDAAYNFPEGDTAELPTNPAMAYKEDQERGIGVLLRAEGDAQVKAIWKTCMPRWREVIGL